MSYHPGQRVECVQAPAGWHRSVSWLDRWLYGRKRIPRLGGVYVVADVEVEYGEIWLDLDGFANLQFASGCFRPIVDDEIALLKRIAAQPERELETC